MLWGVGMSSIYYSENIPCVQYGTGEDAPIYYRVCPKCGRYVKADDISTIPEYLDTNALCKKCGRVSMPFAAWSCELEDWQVCFGED